MYYLLAKFVKPLPDKPFQVAMVQTIGRFRADPDAAERGRRWLQARGVTVHATAFSLACSAPPEVFESLFNVKLSAAGAAWKVAGKIRVPEEIAPLVEDVTLPQPPEFFP